MDKKFFYNAYVMSSAGFCLNLALLRVALRKRLKDLKFEKLALITQLFTYSQKQ